MATRYVARLQNTNTDASNYASVGFLTNNLVTGADAECAAIIIYLAVAGQIAMGAGTSIEAISVRADGAAGSTDMAFPVTEYATQRASWIATGGTVPVMTDWGVPIGAGAEPLAPLGTSISVSEITATAGRTGRGRHYLPYVARGAILADGLLNPAVINLLRQSYDGALRNLGPAANGVDVIPSVRGNASGSTTKAITLVKPQPILSNLKSRRR